MSITINPKGYVNARSLGHWVQVHNLEIRDYTGFPNAMASRLSDGMTETQFISYCQASNDVRHLAG